MKLTYRFLTVTICQKGDNAHMKKLIPVMLVLALCFGLCGCDQLVSIMPGTDITDEAAATSAPEDSAQNTFQERPLYDFMGWDRLKDTYYDNTPIALSYRAYDGEGNLGYASPVFDRASIIAACDARRSVAITGLAENRNAPATDEYILTMYDGTQYVITFSGHDLVMPSGNYTISGADTLRSIPFPGYSGSFDVFDLYFNDDIRAFADGFYSAGGTPISVGRRLNQGATLTATDPDVVAQTFDLLSNATVSQVEMNPDQTIDLTQVTDYVFTTEDHHTYTFSFVGPCLAVTVSNAYGPVYYWLDGADELAGLAILPESTLPVFEGGFISGIREDIQLAADVVNGETEELSVSGVYVDYTIDGTRGYLTLDGDTAVSFIRQVTSISATADTEQAPEGDVITVSVTLSDGSGPIVYFTGNTVQQMVGTNFVCDSSDMSSLRSRILELAQDERNIGQISEGTTE